MRQAWAEPEEPRRVVGMREGVPDGLLASRKLKVFGNIEVARTRYLPGEMEVAPLRGIAVNLHLGGTGRLVTRLEGYAGGRTWERPQRAGAVEVFAAGRSQERTLRGSISEDANVLLGEGFLGQVAEEAGVEPERVEVLGDLDARDPQVERLLLSLLSEIETGGLGGELYSQALATQLAVHLLREHSSLGEKAKGKVEHEPKGDLSGRTLKKATDYVGDNLAEDISLAEIARAANLSERHFSRLFKESTGVSPYQYVIRRRIEKAKVLLASTDLPVGEVALLCGFAHQGHLARHFGRLIGTAPARFRKEARR